MELEELIEQVQWEVRRVAMAFGVVEWQKIDKIDRLVKCESAILLCHIDVIQECAISFCTNTIGTSLYCDVTTWDREAPHEWSLYLAETRSFCDNLMACGLYRLGFADEQCLSQLPSLSAHEKLELRHSMPRGFWPKMWLEEGAE